MYFKDISDLISRALAAPLFGRAEPFVQFIREHHGERLCEIIMNLDQMMFKDISSLERDWMPHGQTSLDFRFPTMW